MPSTLLAGRIVELISNEREAIADTSHRLRTPLTALQLDVDSVEADDVRQRLQDDVAEMERTVDHVIRQARRPVREGAGMTSDLGRNRGRSRRILGTTGRGAGASVEGAGSRSSRPGRRTSRGYLGSGRRPHDQRVLAHAGGVCLLDCRDFRRHFLYRGSRARLRSGVDGEGDVQCGFDGSGLGYRPPGGRGPWRGDDGRAITSLEGLRWRFGSAIGPEVAPAASAVCREGLDPPDAPFSWSPLRDEDRRHRHSASRRPPRARPTQFQGDLVGSRQQFRPHFGQVGLHAGDGGIDLRERPLRVGELPCQRPEPGQAFTDQSRCRSSA